MDSRQAWGSMVHVRSAKGPVSLSSAFTCTAGPLILTRAPRAATTSGLATCRPSLSSTPYRSRCSGPVARRRRNVGVGGLAL